MLVVVLLAFVLGLLFLFRSGLFRGRFGGGGVAIALGEGSAGE